jgi:uncharacterized protein (TIGR01244 family)
MLAAVGVAGMAGMAGTATLVGCSRSEDTSANKVQNEASGNEADTSTAQVPDTTPDTAPNTTPGTAPDNAAGEVAIGTAQRLEGWDGVNNLFNDGRFYFGGQPDEASLKRLASEKGVVTVINIRNESEMGSLGFDEKATVEEMGATYVNIPVSPATFSAADVDRFAAAVEASDGPVLLHCGSSSRAGGMWAAYLVMKQGMDVNTAIERGRAAGLRSGSMVKAVTRILSDDG